MLDKNAWLESPRLALSGSRQPSVTRSHVVHAGNRRCPCLRSIANRKHRNRPHHGNNKQTQYERLHLSLFCSSASYLFLFLIFFFTTGGTTIGHHRGNTAADTTSYPSDTAGHQSTKSAGRPRHLDWHASLGHALAITIKSWLLYRVIIGLLLRKMPSWGWNRWGHLWYYMIQHPFSLNVDASFSVTTGFLARLWGRFIFREHDSFEVNFE